jgi:hypothetical protein
MSSDVPPADHDLRATARWIAVSVVPEPALHPSRHAYRNGAKRSAEPLTVQRLVRAPESLSHRSIIRVSLFRSALRTSNGRFPAMHRVRDQLASRRLSRGAGMRLHEDNYCPPNVLRRVEIAAVNSNLVVGMANEYSSIRRKAAAIARIEAECHQPHAQLGSVAWTPLQLESQLRIVAFSSASASSQPEAEEET